MTCDRYRVFNDGSWARERPISCVGVVVVVVAPRFLAAEHTEDTTVNTSYLQFVHEILHAALENQSIVDQCSMTSLRSFRPLLRDFGENN